METMLISPKTFLLLAALAAPWAAAVELHGQVDVRAVAADASSSWLHGGLGKLRYDRSGVRLGQATLAADADLTDTLAATIVAHGSDDRRGALGVNEAYLGWNPLPDGPWKTRVKAGAFFPVTSLELDYDSVGWTPARTVSSAAINSWIGEELRTKGIEVNFSRNGRLAGSPHDFGVTAALFGWNDETGTLLAWRGWTVSDRITSLSEPLRLADLPVYRKGGELWQNRTIHPFREIDGRLGYYLSASYAYRGMLELTAMHYDNRADSNAIEDRQWSWRTRFNHLGLRLRPGAGWEVVAQAMQGSTLLGSNEVYADYASWFALASHRLGPGQATVRYDRFSVDEEDDILPQDPNSERGHAVALAYALDLSPSFTLVTEFLRVKSERPARALIDTAPRQNERSLTVSLRYHF